MALEESNPTCCDDVFIFPASFAQQRLWFLHQLVPDTALYNVPTVFRLSGVLNVTVLAQSFNALVQRHETLRTTFATSEGQLVQIIASRLKISLPIVDLRELPVSIREAEALQLVWQDIEQSFNLIEGPLLRLLLLRLDETEHILLINLHHIVFDEWSSGVLVRDLGALYSALLENQSAALPALPIQYADFAHWQREWLQGDVLAAHLNYWRQQLKDVPTLNLSSISDVFRRKHSRSIKQHYQGAIQLLELPQNLLNALETLSQQENVTLFMTLLAAFQTLLYRYTGQDDIAVGSPIANRHQSELEGLIGFFVNSLVLRANLSGNPTFRTLLNRVKEVTLGAYAHQDLPFEKLVEELHPERHWSRNPLFQVVFALQNTPMTHLELPGLTLSSLNFETRTTRFDLELYLWKCADDFRSLWGKGWEQSDGLRGVVVYNTNLFESDSIAQLCQHFQTLLEGIIANSDCRLAELPVLTAGERQQLLIDWNDTQTDYYADRCIHQWFEAQVAQTPLAITVRNADRVFTYQDLNRGSNQLAHYLQKLEVGAEVRVGICIERSPEAVAGMLGILKAGGAYVPLDPTYPPERLHFIMEDAQVSVVVTVQRFVERLEDSRAKIICLDREWQVIALESEENPSNSTNAENLAYVMYTSGSTGKPKGVAIPHRAVVRLVCNTNYLQLHSTDKVAQVANLAFDAATFEIWGALLNGAQLIGIDREVLLSPSQLAAQIRAQDITVLFLTTALFNQVVSIVPDAFNSLKYLLFGGETVDPQRVREVLRYGKPEHLLHVYGPTENTTFTSWYEVQEVDENATTVPIGRAIANTQIYVLDPYLNPVPIGVSGEIYLSGDGLAQGYLNRPELTAQRFILNPFSKSRKVHPTPFSNRLYKTGDLARYRPDGNLEFLGRLDNQVKLRGFRIELGEIEAILSQHPSVQATVVNLQTIDGDRRLVAYMVTRQPAPSSQDVRDFLKSKLPDYMLPSAFVRLDALPLTPNGKIDHRALPVTAIKPEATTEVARTSVEAALAEIWSKLLRLEQVCVHDNFFELGGHSLLATQLVSRIRNAFNVEVPLRCLFETPTIAELARYIETIHWAAEGDLGLDSQVERVGLQQREEVEL